MAKDSTKRKSLAADDAVGAQTDSPKKESKKIKTEDAEIPVETLSPIAHPLAGKKLAKKVHKCVKKGKACRYFFCTKFNASVGAKTRNVRRGVKEVVKGVKKGEKG